MDMKRSLTLFLIFLLLRVDGVIFETHHFCELLKVVHQNTLVVLDIDDTLLVCTQTLGTDVWFRYQIKQHEKAGLPVSEAFEKALAEWEGGEHISKIKLVEEGTDKIIRELQEKGV